MSKDNADISDNNEPVDAKASVKRSQKSPTTGYLIALAGIASALAILVLMTLFWSQPALNQSYRDRIINDAADALQQRINLQQQSLLSSTRSLATSARLSQLVTEGDATALALEESRIRETVPHALRVRLIRLGEARIERDSTPPFTFTSVDMVNKTEAGESVFPETIQTNGRWVLGIAAPIKQPSETEVRGTLFLYLDMTAISDAFKDNIKGGFQLMQVFDNNPAKAFLAIGANDSTAPVKRDLQNPHWHILFHPESDLSNAELTGLATYLIPGVAGLLIALATALLALKRQASRVQREADMFSAQLQNVIDGHYQPQTGYQWSGFRLLEDQLASLAERTRSPQPASSTPAEVGTSISEAPSHEEDVQEEVTDKVAAEEQDTEDDLRTIFRAYDIRGIVNQTLTNQTAYKIGQAIGTQAGELGEQALLVGADGRTSSPELMASLINGLLASGRDVINIGVVPTPVLYYACETTGTRSGIMVTGSHNPADHNGFKIVFNGKTLVGSDIEALYERFEKADFSVGEGKEQTLDVQANYINAVVEDVVVAQPLRVVVDCGNGVAGAITPELYQSLGCEIVPLYCEVDGSFPNHHPDPTIPANLQDLIAVVKAQEADLGIAFDGDGDRIVAVTATGDIIAPDQLLMLFAKDVVSRNPGADVVYDVKCTRHLSNVISGFGGRPIICRSGHSYLKEKMAETEAVLGGEFSGHICFGERWFGFDDGLYAGARLLEIVGSQTAGLNDLMQEFPQSVSTPEIKLFVTDKTKFSVVEKLISDADFGEGAISTIDGLRVDFANGWGLVRASNTSPCLTLRFEADETEELERIQQLFREQLKNVDESLEF